MFLFNNEGFRARMLFSWHGKEQPCQQIRIHTSTRRNKNLMKYFWSKTYWMLSIWEEVRIYEWIFLKLPLSFWSEGYDKDPSTSTSIRVAPYFKKFSSDQWPNNKVPNDTKAYSSVRSYVVVYLIKKRGREVLVLIQMTCKFHLL